MKINVLSLFPEQILYNISQSISGRALEKGIFSINCLNIRDFADNSYGSIDDTLFGGGKGMLIQAGAVMRAFKSICPAGKPASGHRALLLSPKGKKFSQHFAESLSKSSEITILCGHYEGIDSRVTEIFPFEEISLGDFVITGGELAACVIIDSVLRLVPGVLPSEEVYEKESFGEGVLECRQYTRPQLFEGFEVPPVLRNGNHADIERWRRKDALVETLKKRPDLLKTAKLSNDDYTLLAEGLTEVQ